MKTALRASKNLKFEDFLQPSSYNKNTTFLKKRSALILKWYTFNSEKDMLFVKQGIERYQGI